MRYESYMAPLRSTTNALSVHDSTSSSGLSYCVRNAISTSWTHVYHLASLLSVKGLRILTIFSKDLR